MAQRIKGRAEPCSPRGAKEPFQKSDKVFGKLSRVLSMVLGRGDTRRASRDGTLIENDDDNSERE